jgi:chromosomal replication initiator protein
MEIDKIHSNYSLDNFVFDYKHKPVFKLIENFSRGMITLPFNFILIQGKIGAGKTHLANAIGNEMNKCKKENKFIYVRSKTLLNNIVLSIRNNKNDEIYRFYSNYDIIVIDDIEKFEGKKNTQEYLIELFEYCFDKGVLIILTSNIPLSDLNDFKEKFTSIISKSMLIKLKYPNDQSKLKILKKIADKSELNIPLHILKKIANKKTKDVRELIGNLITFITFNNGIHIPERK